MRRKLYKNKKKKWQNGKTLNTLTPFTLIIISLINLSLIFYPTHYQNMSYTYQNSSYMYRIYHMFILHISRLSYVYPTHIKIHPTYILRISKLSFTQN